MPLVVDFPDAAVASTLSSFELLHREGSPATTMERIIPDSEAWVYQDPRALASLERGIEDARMGRGRVVSFARYAQEE